MTNVKYAEKFATVLFIVAISLAASNALAEETASEHGSDDHKNVAGIFAGMAHGGLRENAPTIGLEYARHIRGNFSIGAIAEYAAGDADFWVFAIPFAYSFGDWKIYAAPGFEDGHHGKENLLRLGVERTFEMSGGWEIAPQLNVDVVDGDVIWVLGALFARRF